MSTHSTFGFVALLFGVIALSGCTVPSVKDVEIKQGESISTTKLASPIAFGKMIAKIPSGDQIAKIQYGWLCAPGATEVWRAGSRLNITDTEYFETFQQELEAKNYSVVGDPYSLFGDESVMRAKYLVGGRIEKVESNVCFPFSGSPNADIGITGKLKGGVFMRITWQVYDINDKKVVYQATTEGSFQSKEVISGSFAIFLRDAFAANVKNFAADAGFYKLVSESKSSKAAEGI